MVASESFNGQRNPLSALAGRTAAPNAGGPLSTTRTEAPQAPQAPQAEGQPTDQFATKEQSSLNKAPNQPARQAASRSYRGQEKTEISIDARALRQKALEQKAAQEATKGESQAPALPDFPPPPPGAVGSAGTAQAPALPTNKGASVTKQAVPSDFPPPLAKQAVPSDFPPPPPKAAQPNAAKSAHSQHPEWAAHNKAAHSAQTTHVGKATTLQQASTLKERVASGEIQIGEPPIGSHLLKPQSHRAYRCDRDKSDQSLRRMEAKSQLREIIQQRNLGLAPAKKLERQLNQLFALLN